MLTHGIRGIVVHHGRMCGSQSVGLLLAYITAGRQQRLEEEADQTFNACPSDLALSIRLLQPRQTAPPAGNQVLKHRSLWGQFTVVHPSVHCVVHHTLIFTIELLAQPLSSWWKYHSAPQGRHCQTVPNSPVWQTDCVRALLFLCNTSLCHCHWLTASLSLNTSIPGSAWLGSPSQAMCFFFFLKSMIFGYICLSWEIKLDYDIWASCQ